MRYLFLFALFGFLPFNVVLAQGDMTKEVEADTMRWPVPQLDTSWKLEYMPHNNANHNVYVYKDKLYDALFTRTKGWNGGDGVQTTALPDGNVFWSFNDSFYGVATASPERARKSCNFPCKRLATTGCLGQRRATSSGSQTGCSVTTLQEMVTIMLERTFATQRAKRPTRRFAMARLTRPTFIGQATELWSTGSCKSFGLASITAQRT